MQRVHSAATSQLSPTTLYQILALRVAVFVVEQQCPYLDLDGRDLESSTRQLWIEQDNEIVGTLRLLTDPPDPAVPTPSRARIGRVATAQSARGRGLAAELMRRAIELTGPVEIVLDAQAYLAGWYTHFGFVRDGADFVEDGIAHVPMRRATS